MNVMRRCTCGHEESDGRMDVLNCAVHGFEARTQQALSVAAEVAPCPNCRGAVSDRDALTVMLKRLLDVALVDGYGETVRDEAEALLARVGGQ